MKNAANLNIDLNVKDKYGKTGFHWAYQMGHSTDIVKIIKENAADLSIDLNV